MDDATRNRVWIAMAEHYLDSETRPELPRTALVCVEAGLSVEEARRIWRQEVDATLGVNLLSVAGEWGAWDEAWLIEKLTKQRAAIAKHPFLIRILYPACFQMNPAAWASIERYMRALLAAAPEARAGLANELSQKIESELS